MSGISLFLSSLAIVGSAMDIPICRDGQDIDKIVSKAVVRVEVVLADGSPFGHGSGTVFNEERAVVTSDHVVPKELISTGAKVWVVQVKTGERFEYRVRKRVSEDATAVLEPASVTRPIDFLKLRVSEPQVGEMVYMKGFPFSFGSYFSQGVVSQTEHTENDSLLKTGEFFLTNINVSPGMSGAAAFDCETNVVGFVLGSFNANTSISIFNRATADIRTLFSKTQYEIGGNL